MIYATSWHCSGSLVTTVLSEDCTVTGTSTDISSPTTSPYVVTYYDWLFVQLIVIFFLSLIVWGFFFRGFNFKKRSW